MSTEHTTGKEPAQSATILLAHGSTDENWLAPFRKMHDDILQQTQGQRVELAYMELAEPSLKQMIATLVSEGITRIEILPLFFAAGRHLRKDVPAMLEDIKAESAIPLTLNLHTPVGLEPEISTAISQLVIRKVL